MPNITPQEIVEQARTWLGTAYHHQGRLKKSDKGPGGVDCIGLIIGVINELGMPDTEGRGRLALWDEGGYSQSPDGFSLRRSIERHLIPLRQDEMAPGDILLFKLHRDPQHLGIVSDYPGGDIGVIHCHSRSGAVVEHPLSPAWRRMLVKPYRFRPEHLRRLPHE